jgi:hypothetical protein
MFICFGSIIHQVTAPAMYEVLVMLSSGSFFSFVRMLFHSFFRFSFDIQAVKSFMISVPSFFISHTKSHGLRFALRYICVRNIHESSIPVTQAFATW